MSIISISGKIGSGKDTVGEIIQIITKSPHFTDEAVLDYIGREHLNPVFENQKWANVLKDYVCMAINCTREQLEDREFKDKELGKEWWYYGFGEEPHIAKLDYLTYRHNTTKDGIDSNEKYIIKPTYRSMFTSVGTDAIRKHVHPNYWVNCLMSKYKYLGSKNIENQEAITVNIRKDYPNWIITDTRFPNELKAVKDRGGISIRVNRELKATDTLEIIDRLTNVLSKEHISETALDNAEFDYNIENDGSIIELIGKVREILIKENFIK